MGILNTLDLDFAEKDRVLAIIKKIERCNHLKGISAKNSLSRGYHITLYCDQQSCDLCRFVFDDPKRYFIDFKRPAHLQNVLFDNYREVRK